MPLGRLGLRHDDPLQPLRPLLHPLRWRKSQAEVAALRRSAGAAAAALRACIGHTRPGRHERDLAALFNFRCAVRGAQGLSYPPVAGAGANSCTVHYSRNDAQLQGGQLMLMDAGCEMWGYASDVTRVWPVSGRFSPAQRLVYDHVARTHSACREALRPGTRLRDVHALSVQLLSDALRDLGVAVGALGDYRRFYPHSVGHWLGLDTHDCASVSYDTPLEEGVVLTLEPALYLRGEGVPQQLQGIGVRIEDDLVVTKDAVEVLSGGVPTAAEELEALVGSQAGQWRAVSGLAGDG
jgi:Xaa-Pro aminopeptidase